MITLFLDIDGVITTPKQWDLSFKAKSRLKDYHNIYPFDKKCVEILNEILGAYEMKIVIHSDWMYHFDLKQLQEIFEINGVNQVPYNITGGHYHNDPFLDRLFRIENYVKEYGIKDFFILDDIPLESRIIQDSFFHIENGDEGLKQSNVKEKIFKFLENKFK